MVLVWKVAVLTDPGHDRLKDLGTLHGQGTFSSHARDQVWYVDHASTDAEYTCDVAVQAGDYHRPNSQGKADELHETEEMSDRLEKAEPHDHERDTPENCVPAQVCEQFKRGRERDEAAELN